MIAAKKSLGQNFLTNPSVCEKIAELLKIKAVDKILEIGSGRGALTSKLLKRGGEALVLLEKDRELAFRRENLGDASVINMDALDFPWERLRALGLWKLAGNLPYNIASPLIWDIVSRCDGWERAVFMFQKEVAERIVSPAGSGKYGALSVWIQSFADPVYEFAVKPGSFYPPPKVDSAVVSFVPLPASAAPRRPLALKRLLTVCFGQRRKQIGGIFRKNNMDLLFPYLEKLGIADSARPEEIRPEQFKILAESLSTGA